MIKTEQNMQNKKNITKREVTVIKETKAAEPVSSTKSSTFIRNADKTEFQQIKNNNREQMKSITPNNINTIFIIKYSYNT